nr:MAG: RNA-dependent RNA polymerase [Porcine picobirnavirus]UAW00558.1 MAG: RNA-dependent RNA polymerase [Porcine picobirnavirus]
MFKSSEVKFGDYFKLPNQGLKSYFGKVVKGQSKVYDTPFAKGESTTHLLNQWNEVLKSIDDEWPTLYEYEMEMRGKVGPLSVMAPLSERMPSIEEYYQSVKGNFAPISERAVKACISEWGRARGLNMRSQANTLANMKLSTNSGSPFFTKRRNVIKETSPCTATSPGGTVLQILPGGEWNACAVLGWRGQEGGSSKEDVKQRVVWMFPFAVNLLELQVYQPLIESAQKFNIVPAWVSNAQVDKEITQLFDTKGPEDLIVCTDFTAFDQHFNRSLQNAARAVIAGILAPNEQHSGWLAEVFPIKYQIPLAYDYGKIKYGEHGMGSGSGGTNADETLAHRCLQYEAAQTMGKRLNPHSMCLGDDGILTFPGITVDDVVRCYTQHGLEMNDSKQYSSTQDCVYLRRWHHASYRVDGVCAGVYPTMRALGRLRYLERFMDPEVWGPKMVALRQLSILENVKYHPLKEKFVDFCMKRDKYRLGIDIPGFLDNIEDEAKKATDYMPDFLGYTNSLQADATGLGIESWWIVNYLKSLS